jgi:hypothetical protein
MNKRRIIPLELLGLAALFLLLALTALDSEAAEGWKPTSEGPPSARYFHTAIWTGTEMIVWGGTNGSASLKTGGRYDPATNHWSPPVIKGAPAARHSHTAVWTGTEMIVWGGYAGAVTNTGGRYTP